MSGHSALIVFTRYPQPGQAKTRLIPALGAEGAAELQRRMTAVTVGRAWSFCATIASAKLTIAFEGGDAARMREWLGPLDFVKQGDGDLGQRLRRAALRAFATGAGRVVIIGSDCPSLTEEGLAVAFTATHRHGIVFGPAGDGGYYLVALTHPSQVSLFENIPWSTAAVLSASCDAARAMGHEPALLATLPDVDEPADLPAAEAALHAAGTVSVIIPALNEAANLARLLPALNAAAPHEIIIADGGSTDETAAVAARFGARHVRTAKGRGAQMNAAAATATGEFLLFLHADTDPPAAFPDIIRKTLMSPGTAAGAFTFRLREPFRGAGQIEKGVALRCRIRSLPYGDQGLFLRRSLFSALQGFPEWPILEDVAFVRRLRGHGRIVTTPEAALTSSRRWQQRGVLCTFLRHQLILAGYVFGISPQRLAGWR
ncbi:MAG: TIGR04283 family arsenosugar biosynthesis glycosyltransferase [Verrucomicrobiota bacterium]